MVHENQYHPLPEQGRSLQIKARPVSTGELFPRLLGRQRRQSSSKIPIVAIQSSQSRTPQSLPPVSPTKKLPIVRLHGIANALTKPHTSHRHIEYQARLCRSQGHNPSQRAGRFRHPISEATSYVLTHSILRGSLIHPQGSLWVWQSKQCTYPPLLPTNQNLNLSQDE